MAAIKNDLNIWSDFTWEKARAMSLREKQCVLPLLHTSRERTIQVFGPSIKIFQPGSTFPSISITGDQCALDCLHCNKRYLKHMNQALTPERLIELCRQLDDRGAVGCLISGGCDAGGSVPLDPFLDAISTIKRETRLILNLHTGFLTPTIAKRLGDIGIDAVSFDVNGSSQTVEEIYHLSRGLADYKQSLDLLTENHINFVPHICVGLHYGHLKGEVDALKLLSDYAPSTIVFIVLIPPPRGPAQGMFVVPSPEDVAKMFCIARAAFPKTELLLGCMRPGGKIRHSIEQRAIESGATCIVQPTRETRDWLKSQNLPIKVYYACCAIPPTLFDKAGN